MDHKPEKVTHQDIRKLITELPLSPNMISLFDGNCTDEIMKRYHFDHDYNDPYAVLELTKIQQDHYFIDRYKPFLAYSNSRIFAYDTQLKGYVVYYLEGGIQDLKTALTWDGLFIDEILRWWEREIEDEHILHIGNYFGLKHTQLILDSIYNTTNGEGFATFPEKEEWRTKILLEINGKIE